MTNTCTTNSYTSCTIIINKSGVINNNDTIISCTNSCTNIRVTTISTNSAMCTIITIIGVSNITDTSTNSNSIIIIITTNISNIGVNINNYSSIGVTIISINGVNNNYGVSINNITITNITDFIVNRVFRLKLLILKITEIFEIT